MEDRLTDKPPGPEPWGEVPPWERPGAVRRDCEPHHGDLLFTLGSTAFLAALLSCMFGLVGLGLLCFPVALPLGLVVWAVARHDLARMHSGMMDPRGDEKTEDARRLGLAAVWFGLVGAAMGLFWGLLMVRHWD
jgi:hypothetical protein